MLERRCDLLRSLHVPGKPLVLPNAWDVPSASAVVAAGFPVVATTSGGVAESLGYEDEEHAPAEEMFGAARRIARSVDVPVTVDAETGYGLAARELVDALLEVGAAGCNFEDTDHAAGGIVDADRHTDRLAEIRSAASERGYGLVINARIDVFLARRDVRPQARLVDEALARARSYRDAGADCVYPIFLHEDDAIAAFVAGAEGPVNILALSDAPAIGRLAELGVARISYGSALYHRAMNELAGWLREIPRPPADPDPAT